MIKKRQKNTEKKTNKTVFILALSIYTASFLYDANQNGFSQPILTKVHSLFNQKEAEKIAFAETLISEGYTKSEITKAFPNSKKYIKSLDYKRYIFTQITWFTITLILVWLALKLPSFVNIRLSRNAQQTDDIMTNTHQFLKMFFYKLWIHARNMKSYILSTKLQKMKVRILGKDITISKLQLIIVIISALTLIVMTIIPPWMYTFSYTNISTQYKPGPYGFLFSPPLPYDSFRGVILDTERLIIQYILVLISATTAFALSGLPKRTPVTTSANSKS